MDTTWYTRIWIFFLYSFAGWLLNTVYLAAVRRRFVNTGFLNVPLCPAYGAGAVLATIFLSELRGHIFFLFLGGAILSSLVCLLTGLLLEHFFHRKWWDTTASAFQYEGYVSLPFAALCGVASAAVVELFNPLLYRLLSLLPAAPGHMLLGALCLILAADFLGSLTAVWQMRVRLRRIDQLSDNLQKMTDSLGNALTRRIQRRMMRAYPNLAPGKLLADAAQTQRRPRAQRAAVFASGCCFYKLFWLFLLGSLLGDLTETIFCYVSTGVLMSRSSLVFGPFSIVWGFGCALLTALLYHYKDKNDRYLFLAGTILGGAYEYMCSVLSELVFGTVFWDYSKLPFNLGGRINLLYCFFWGIAAVIWLRGLYPPLSRIIERIPRKPGVILTWLLVLFMAANMLLSAMALDRYSKRQSGTPPQTAVGAFLDEQFPDSRMNQIYPNAKRIDASGHPAAFR